MRRPAVFSGLILLFAVVIGISGVANGRSVPRLTYAPDPAVRGESFTLVGTGFQGHPNVVLEFSDNHPDIQIKVGSAGRFTWNEILPYETPDQWTIVAFDAKTRTALAYAESRGG